MGIKGRTEIATQGTEQRALLKKRSAEVNSHRPPLEIPPEEAPTTTALGLGLNSPRGNLKDQGVSPSSGSQSLPQPPTLQKPT